MNREISKNLFCVVTEDGVEIWIEEDKVDSLIEMINELPANSLIKIGKDYVRNSKINGIYSSQTMEIRQRRRMGQWMCKYGHWHDKGEKCAHGELEKLEKMYPTYSEK